MDAGLYVRAAVASAVLVKLRKDLLALLYLGQALVDLNNALTAAQGYG